MSAKIRALQAQKADALKAMRELNDKATAEGREFSEDEQKSYDEHAARVASLNAAINRETALAAEEAQMQSTAVTPPARAPPAAESASAATARAPTGYITVSENREQDPTRGFRSFGEFALAVRAACGPMARHDERLGGIMGAAPSSYGNEGTGADGGFLVPPQFATEIMNAAYDERESFVPLTDQQFLEQSNSMIYPIDENTPWGGGVQAYWTNEAQASTQSKANVQPASLRLNKLTALVPITEELQADSGAMASYIQSGVPVAISFKTNQALWEGNGIGKPRGVFNASAAVTVSKESGQAAASIVLANVTKMRARMPANSYRRAVWMINVDCLPQLDAMAYAQALTNKPIYDPVGGQYGYGTLLGRPVMCTDFNETCGTKGDIALIDWKRYRTIQKREGVQVATSMHFWFDQGINAYRVVFRIDGQPIPTKAITPNKGSNSLSPFVLLEARG